MSLWVIPQRIKMPTNCKNIWTAFLIISIFLNDISQQARGGGGGSKDGVVVRAHASHQCGLGSNPGVDAIIYYVG